MSEREAFVSCFSMIDGVQLWIFKNRSMWEEDKTLTDRVSIFLLSDFSRNIVAFGIRTIVGRHLVVDLFLRSKMSRSRFVRRRKTKENPFDRFRRDLFFGRARFVIRTCQRFGERWRSAKYNHVARPSSKSSSRFDKSKLERTSQEFRRKNQSRNATRKNSLVKNESSVYAMGTNGTFFRSARLPAFSSDGTIRSVTLLVRL